MNWIFSSHDVCRLRAEVASDAHLIQILPAMASEPRTLLADPLTVLRQHYTLDGLSSLPVTPHDIVPAHQSVT